MKFVLILIAAILVFLGIYTYSNQTTEKSAPIPKTFEKKVEAQETEKVSVVTQEVKEKKSSVKNIAVKSPKVVSQELSEEMQNEEMQNEEMENEEIVSSSSTFEGMQDEIADFSNIGKGLTLESIQNSDVSEDEKELMLDDLAAYQSYRDRNNPSISKEEGMKALTKEFN